MYFRKGIVVVGLRIWRGICRDISSYLSVSTVHGFRYIAEGENLAEKLFWVAIMIMGILYSGWMNITSFQEWENVPLATTIDRLTMHIKELNQPAITVCNPEGLEMPRRNRWMYMEKLLNWVDNNEGNIANTILSNF